MDQIYVTGVATNIKGEITMEFDGPAVYLLGNNGSGKTAILNAISLALTKQAFDLGIRDDAKDAGILARLIPQGDTKLYATVNLSNGDEASFELTPGKRPVWKPAKTPVLYAYEEILDGLYGSRTKALEFFVRWFLDDADLKPLLSNPGFTDAAVGEAYDALYTATSGDIPEIEQWLAMLRQSEENLTAARGRAKELKTVVGYLEGLVGQTSDVHKRAVACRDAIRIAQIDGGYSKCAICGTPHETEFYAARLAKTEAWLAGRPETHMVPPEVLATVRTDAEVAEAQVETMAGVREALYGMAQAAVLRARPKICRAVSDHLTKNFTFGFDLTDKAFMPGWAYDDGEQQYIHPCASGGEKVRLVSAVAACVARKFEGLTVIVLPDRALDGDTLRASQHYLKLTGANVFIQNPWQPRGRPTTGWCKIEMGTVESEAV